MGRGIPEPPPSMRPSPGLAGSREGLDLVLREERCSPRGPALSLGRTCAATREDPRCGYGSMSRHHLGGPTLWPGSLAAAREDPRRSWDEDPRSHHLRRGLETSAPLSVLTRRRETHAPLSTPRRRRETHAPSSVPRRRRETRRRPCQGGGRPVAIRTEEEGGRSAPWPLALLCGGREGDAWGESRDECGEVRKTEC
jgi:hypothetical protein